MFIYERFRDDFFKYSDKNVVSPQNNSQRHKKSAGNLIDQKAEVSWPISVVLCALDFADGANFKGFFWQSVTKVVLKGLDSFCGWQVANTFFVFLSYFQNENVEKVEKSKLKLPIHFRISCASKTHSSSFRNQLFVCVRLQNMSKHVKMVQPKGSGCQSTRSSLRSQGIIMFTKPRK